MDNIEIDYTIKTAGSKESGGKSGGKDKSGGKGESGESGPKTTEKIFSLGLFLLAAFLLMRDD